MFAVPHRVEALADERCHRGRRRQHQHAVADQVADPSAGLVDQPTVRPRPLASSISDAASNRPRTSAPSSSSRGGDPRAALLPGLPGLQGLDAEPDPAGR